MVGDLSIKDFMAKGWKMTDEQKKRLSLAHKGIISWNKGLKHSEKHRLALSKAWVERKRSGRGKAWNKDKKGLQVAWNKGIPSEIKDEHKFNWKGDKVGYGGLHQWIGRKLGKPKKCEDCGTIKAKMYNWANISGEYKRDLKDWKRLCRKCHHRFDDISKRAWITKRKRYAYKYLWGKRITRQESLAVVKKA